MLRPSRGLCILLSSSPARVPVSISFLSRLLTNVFPFLFSFSCCKMAWRLTKKVSYIDPKRSASNAPHPIP